MKYTNNQKVKEEERSKEKSVYSKDQLGDCGSYQLIDRLHGF